MSIAKISRLVSKLVSSVVIGIFITNCARDSTLTRSEAAEMLSAHFRYTGHYSAFICIGICDIPGLVSEKIVVAMVEAGYLRNEGLKVVFTDKGRKASEENLGWNKIDKEKYRSERLKNGDVYGFTLAEWQLIKVTGISQEDNNAIVEYEWKWKANALGSELKNVVYLMSKSSRAIFRLYDDGWRIENAGLSEEDRVSP